MSLKKLVRCLLGIEGERERGAKGRVFVSHPLRMIRNRPPGGGIANENQSQGATAGGFENESQSQPQATQGQNRRNARGGHPHDTDTHAQGFPIRDPARLR